MDRTPNEIIRILQEEYPKNRERVIELEFVFSILITWGQPFCQCYRIELVCGYANLILISMKIEFIKSLAIFSIIQICIWAFFLLKSKKAHKEQRHFLIQLTVIFTLFIMGIIFQVFGRNKLSQYMINVSNSTVLLVLPLFYHFLKVVKNEQESSNPLGWQLLPFTVFFVLGLTIRKILECHFLSYHVYAVALIITFYLQCIYYFISIHRMSGKRLFSFSRITDSHHISTYSWLKPFLTSFSILIFLKTSIFIVWNVFQLKTICVFLCTAFLITSFALINLLILFALLRKERILTLRKYESISLNKNEIDFLYEKIIHELQFNKGYRNPLINLGILSKKTGIPTNRISMIINEKSGKNFNELINAYRIDEAKQMLIDNQNNTNILDIAFEVGYNSKSTFNTAFKKIIGVTPSEYRQNNV